MRNNPVKEALFQPRCSDVFRVTIQTLKAPVEELGKGGRRHRSPEAQQQLDARIQSRHTETCVIAITRAGDIHAIGVAKSGEVASNEVLSYRCHSFSEIGAFSNSATSCTSTSYYLTPPALAYRIGVERKRTCLSSHGTGVYLRGSRANPVSPSFL